MAIQIKTIKRVEPGIVGGGTKKYYANPVHDRELSLEGVTKIIERACTLTGADIRAVLYALVEEAVNGLSEGKIVRLGDLGSLRVTIHSEGKDTPEEVCATTVKKAGVIFTPGKKLKEMLRIARFEKV